MKMNFILVLSILLLFSCDRRIERIYEIPKEFQGEWVDKDLGEWKKVIRNDKIYHYELEESLDTSVTVNYIREIYKAKRKKCEDCISYGIEITFADKPDEKTFLYLDNFHSDIDEYIELSEWISVYNENEADWVWVNNSEWIKHIKK